MAPGEVLMGVRLKVSLEYLPNKLKNLWMNRILSTSLLIWVLLSIVILALPARSLDGSLLRTLFQGMVTLFGLVFTGSLVASQLLSRYSFRALKLAISPRWLMRYGLPFVIAIALPLIFSLFTPNPWAIKVCIISSLLALFILFPYFYDILSRLRPHSLAKLLGQQARKKSKDLRQEEIQALDELATSALGVKDYETFSIALRELKNLYFLDSKEVWQSYSKLCNIALEDPWAFNFSADALIDFGKEAIKRKREDSIKLVLRELEGEFFKAVREGHVPAAVSIASAASAISRSFIELAFDKALRNLLARVILTLELICHHAAKREMWKPAFESAGSLLDIGMEFLEKDKFIVEMASQALQKIKRASFGEGVVIDAIGVRLGNEDKVKRFLKLYLPDVYQRFGWR